MKTIKKTTPRQFEGMLIRFIVVDFVLMFFLLSLVINLALILNGLIIFPYVLLLVPAVVVLSFIFSVGRFYGYITSIIRVMGALDNIYEEFGGGEAELEFNFPKPFLVFPNLLNKESTPSDAKTYSFKIKTKSQKYEVTASCEIQKGEFSSKLSVVDWHGLEHKRELTGKISSFQSIISNIINNIRREVLESRGIKVKEIEKKKEDYYVPKQAITKEKIKPLKITPKKVPEKKEFEPDFELPKFNQPTLEKPKFEKPKPLVPISKQVSLSKPKPIPLTSSAPKVSSQDLQAKIAEEVQKQLKLVPLQKTSVNKEELEARKALEGALGELSSFDETKTSLNNKMTGSSKKEKEALQDALFQLEEIQKLIKE